MCGPMRRPTAAGRNRRHLPYVLKLTSIPPDALLPISISYDPELTGADRVTAPTGDFLDTFRGRNEFWSCRNGANDGWRKGIDYSRNCFQRWHWNRSRHDLLPIRAPLVRTNCRSRISSHRREISPDQVSTDKQRRIRSAVRRSPTQVRRGKGWPASKWMGARGAPNKGHALMGERPLSLRSRSGLMYADGPSARRGSRRRRAALPDP